MVSQWSRDCLKRKELIANLRVPDISEIKFQIGLPLSLVIFEECHPDLRVLFGLERFLEGPKGELWQSPSDLLIGKVALKPPLTQKHIQALTHQGIMDIGTEIEQKFMNQMKMEKIKALEDHGKFLKALFETKKIALEKSVRQEEKQNYNKHIAAVRTAFDNKMCETLWQCFDQIKLLEEQLNVEFDSLNLLWQEKLEKEIQDTVRTITEKFLVKMGKQEKILVTTFRKQIQKLKHDKNCAIEFERTKCKEAIKQMKHRLHCENIANLMYLLCKERRMCKKEKDALEKNYSEMLHKKTLCISRKNKAISNLKKQNDKKIKQVKLRERCLTEILRQFQKFIYYALKAAPTQGEFLLNIDKLIKFEINDYCIHEEKEKTKHKPEEAIAEGISTQIEDYMKISKSPSEEQIEYSDALPALYFNNKMYIREDFRDMIDAGIPIDEKNSLWNPDVEELLNIFRGNLNSKRSNLVDYGKSHSSVHFTPDVSSDSLVIAEQLLNASEDFSPSVSLSSGRRTQETKKMSKTLGAKDKDASKESPRKRSLENGKCRNVSLTYPSKSSRESSKLNVADVNVTKSMSQTQSRLTLARDSLILHISNIERKSIQIISKSLEKTEPKADDSIIEDEEIVVEETVGEWTPNMSMMPEVKSVQSIGHKPPPTSKLLLATDSVELFKRSNIGIDTTGEHETSSKETPSHGTPGTEPATSKTTTIDSSSKQNIKSVRKVVSKTSRKPTAKVVGSRKMKEHLKNIDEFTDERIRDLVSVIKEDPSLIRLFTPCLN